MWQRGEGVGKEGGWMPIYAHTTHTHVNIHVHVHVAEHPRDVVADSRARREGKEVGM